MIRKLFVLFAMAIAAMAVVAPMASAEEPVHVEIANGEEMIEVTGTNTIAIQVLFPPWIDFLRCDNHWEATVSEDGQVHVHDIVLTRVAGSTANCEGADDCGSEWEGQIFEDEATGDPKIEFRFCTNRTGPGEVVCDMDVASMHCDAVFIHNSTSARVNGEVFFDHGLTIEDAH